MSFCGTCHGGFSKGSQDQHAAHAGPINPHELAELERYERDPRFYPALQRYQQISSQYRTPFLGGSSKDGSRVYQDGRYAQRVAAGQVRLGGQPYDPTKYMFTHEAVEGVLIRQFGLSYPAAHKLATAAERLSVEHDGINWAQHTAAMRPEIHLAEKESGSGTPPDLLVDPYKGTKYDRKVEENERANAALPVQGTVNPGAGNSAGGGLPSPAMAGPAGGYRAANARSDNRGTQQSGDDWPGKPDKGQGMAKFYLIRHGKTALNASNQSDDKIRGWKDVPLDATGKREAVDLGSKLKDSGINFIAHSNMKRSKDTAEEIAKTTGAKIVSRPGLRPWNVGVFTGESSGKVHPELRRMAEEAPDRPIPEGESFTQFKCRVFASLYETLEESSGKRPAIVTHHRDERLIHSWIAKGQPTDMSIDYPTMFQHGEAPANADIVAVDPERLRLAAEAACAELNKQGFQKYTHKAAGYHEGFGPPTPEHPEGSHCGVCRYFKGKDKCMIVVPPIGADDGCALFMPKGTKTGDGGGADRGEAVGGYNGSIADQAMADVAQNRTPHQILQSTLDPQVQNLGQSIAMSAGTAGGLTRDALERMDIDTLDKMAWGHAQGETVTLDPTQIKIRYPDDLVNPQDKFDKGGIGWARSVDQSEPVSLSIDKNGKFNLEDGHHRWFAAKKLGKPITGTIDKITGKPIERILQRQGGGYSEGDMKVRNGKFDSTNWDEEEGPGGRVTGAPPRADGASHMYSGVPGGYSRRGGYDPELPQNAPGQLQGVLSQPTAPTPPPPPVMGVDPAITQVGGFAKGNYAVGAGGPPKSPPLEAPSMPKMKIKASAVAAHTHNLAKGSLVHLLKGGHIDKATHDKHMASIDSALAGLMNAKAPDVKPKVGKVPMPKPPSGGPPEPAGASKGRLGSLGAGNALPYPPPDFGGYGGMGSIGQAMGGQGAQPQQGMQGPMMPWQK